MQTQGTQTSCIYRWQNGVHEFILQESSERAVDELVYYLEVIAQDPPVSGVNLYLLDTAYTDGLPFNYLSRRMRDFAARYPNNPPSRMAIMHDGSVLLKSVGLLISRAMSRSKRVNFFRADHRAKAVAWLLS